MSSMTSIGFVFVVSVHTKTLVVDCTYVGRRPCLRDVWWRVEILQICSCRSEPKDTELLSEIETIPAEKRMEPPHHLSGVALRHIPTVTLLARSQNASFFSFLCL